MIYTTLICLRNPLFFRPTSLTSLLYANIAIPVCLALIPPGATPLVVLTLAIAVPDVIPVLVFGILTKGSVCVALGPIAAVPLVV